MKTPSVEMLTQASDWIRFNEGDGIHPVADWIDHQIALAEKRGGRELARRVLAEKGINPTPDNVKKVLAAMKRKRK